jgi:ATP-binding cassette, subfamily C, bacterial CydC
LRRLITIVGQHTHLFNASIRDNLRLVQPEASDDQLWAALAQAAIDDEVRALQGGLDTVVGELGAYLSGGQARRIAIARAFLSKAPIVLLDEPTEGLDTANAARVSAAIDRLVENRTAILITHRRHAKVSGDLQLSAPFRAA